MSSTKQTKRAVIYCRVEDIRNEKDLAKQKKQCREYARNNGYQVVKVFTDVSKEFHSNRDGFKMLVHLCYDPEKRKRIKTLITPSMEVVEHRSLHDVKQAIKLLQAMEMKVKFLSLDYFMDAVLTK